jgi:hypothetical protein
MEVDD